MSQPNAIHAYADAKELSRGNTAVYRELIKLIIEGMAGVPPGVVNLAKYEFQLHDHPAVSTVLVDRLVGSTDEQAIDTLQAADTDPSIAPRALLDPYKPSSTTVVAHGTDPMLDFTEGDPYAIYNEELFFHIPLTIAIQLAKNERYAEARHWLHYIFDPTDQSSEATPRRYWKYMKFKDLTDLHMIEDILSGVAADPTLQKQIKSWQMHPFSPHAAAKFRPIAYMLKTVMTYLDVLIQWGDSLFRQETRESINDALQLYILAGQLLGERPQRAPLGTRAVPTTYARIRGKVDDLGIVAVELEPEIPFDTGPLGGAAPENARFGVVRTLSRLLFCIPHNERLLAYWDTVADRLFKIRNSLDIQGVFRQLPLFPPPIDPALLAAAAAAGLDIAAVASGALQPLPIVRYTTLAHKAGELAQEVRALAAQTLSTIEKIDGEKLALLRATQERRLLELGEVVRYGQYQEARKSREALERSLVTATERYHYYERLLGKQEAELRPATFDALDTEALDQLALAATEPTIARRDVPVDSSLGPPPPAGGLSGSPIPPPPAPAGAQPLPELPAPPDPLGLREVPEVDFGSHLLSSPERDELTHLQGAQQRTSTAGTSEVLGALMNIIPSFSVDLTPLGIGTTVSFGGSNIAAVFSAMAATDRSLAAQETYRATLAGKLDAYTRREMDWAFQSNLAAGEVQQIYKQLRAAQIHEAVAEREWKNHKTQIEHARDMETFLTDDRKGKTANQAFYARMKSELRGLHTRGFDLAFDVAKKAERALQYELGDPTARFLAPSYLAGNEGLLAGDKLVSDLRRMEVAYLERNARELELTKHVSLLALAPRALLDLRADGKCTIQLPEALFDLDGPGHYFRRLKAVSVTIPCVSGPYTNVACKLTLVKSSIRMTTSLDGQYTRKPDDDPRFSDYFGTLESVVTSSGIDDAGLFEVNLRDDRYLPFEGHGAISEWALELPAVQTFDRQSISDVILRIRYTARDGGLALRDASVASVRTSIADAVALGSVRLFSIRHEFPSEWARFKAAATTAAGFTQLAFELSLDHFPFWRREIKPSELAVLGSNLYVRAASPPEVAAVAPGTDADTLVPVASGLFGFGDAPKTPKAITSIAGRIALYFNTTALDDVFLAIAWGKQRPPPT